MEAILVVIMDGEYNWGLGSFNDEHKRTFDEIAKVIDTAIIMTGGSYEESTS